MWQRLVEIQSEHWKEESSDAGGFECSVAVGCRQAGLTTRHPRFEKTWAFVSKRLSSCNLGSLLCLLLPTDPMKKVLHIVHSMLTGGRATVIVEPLKDNSMRRCVKAPLRWWIEDVQSRAEKGLGGLPYRLQEERMHNGAPASMLVSSTPLYDAHGDKRDAGLPLHSPCFSASATKRWPWGNQLCSSSDVGERCCTAMCERRLLSCENKKTLLHTAHMQAQGLLCTATFYLSTAELDRARFE